MGLLVRVSPFNFAFSTSVCMYYRLLPFIFYLLLQLVCLATMLCCKLSTIIYCMHYHILVQLLLYITSQCYNGQLESLGYFDLKMSLVYCNLL